VVNKAVLSEQKAHSLILPKVKKKKINKIVILISSIIGGKRERNKIKITSKNKPNPPPRIAQRGNRPKKEKKSHLPELGKCPYVPSLIRKEQECLRSVQVWPDARICRIHPTNIR
jgi:hypothetical protein